MSVGEATGWVAGLDELTLGLLPAGNFDLEFIRKLATIGRLLTQPGFQVSARLLKRLFEFLALLRLRLQQLAGFVQLTRQIANLRFKFFPRFGQLRFQGFPNGQIGHHPQRTFEFTALGAHGRRRKRGQTFRPVLAPEAEFVFDFLPFPLLREQVFGVAVGGFGQKIDHRAVRQLLDLVAEDRGHLRIHIVGAELGVEQPRAFIGRLDHPLETFPAAAQTLLQFLALKELLHLLFGDGQPHLQCAEVIRLGQKIVGADRQHLAHVTRPAGGGGDHDENLVAIGLRPHPFAEVQAVHARQANIREEQWIRFLLISQNGLLGVVVGDNLVTALRQHFGQQALTLHVAFYNQRLHLVFSVINASFTARNSCPIFPGNRSASTAVFSQPAAFKFAGALRRDGKVNSPQLSNPPPRDLRSIAHSFQLAQGRLFIGLRPSRRRNRDPVPTPTGAQI